MNRWADWQLEDKASDSSGGKWGLPENADSDWFRIQAGHGTKAERRKWKFSIRRKGSNKPHRWHRCS